MRTEFVKPDKVAVSQKKRVVIDRITAVVRKEIGEERERERERERDLQRRRRPVCEPVPCPVDEKHHDSLQTLAEV